MAGQLEPATGDQSRARLARDERLSPDHDVTDAAKRLIQGMGEQAPRFVGVFAIDKEAPKALWVLTLACSAVLFALAVRGMVREQDSWTRLYTILFVLAGFLLYSWFSAITYASRFAATFGPVFAWYAAAEIQPLLRQLAECRWPARPELHEGRPWGAHRRGHRRPADPLPGHQQWKSPARAPKRAAAAEAGLREAHGLVRSERGAHRRSLHPHDGSRLAIPVPLAAAPVRALQMPKAPGFAGFMAWADKARADYLLLARPAPEYADFLKPTLGGFIRDDPAAGLVQIAPIPGWQLVMEDGDGVCDYLIYQRRRTP